MQFVKNGPDVPEKLLQSHEEGRVVFFCGAGISRPAKLPDFGGLVWKLYEAVGIIPDPVQKQALKSDQFDTAVSLLEATYKTNEWRREVREKMAQLLKPDYSPRKATRTHQALLQLAKTSENKTRLITTNFDRIFEKVVIDEKLDIKHFKAPLLPVPKNRWDGLIYLHGLLPKIAKGPELDHLVISSGDFGLAYLTERWAARFVSELFRSYTVCFVGYSLNDPVLRYMMDALAADRLLGESPPEMFAFGNFKSGEFEKEEQQWLAKNVTPILYKNHQNHYYLHETLAKWSETYRDGLSGKEQIVVTTAFTNPNSSDLHNDYAKKLAWALSDPTGIPAKRFSKLNPAPPLTWLKVLSTIELKKEDLSRFGIFDNTFEDEIKFNLFNRPAKSSLSPSMALSRHPFVETEWDDVMKNLGDWLARHLNNPDLVLFILKQGGILNSKFQWKINHEIEEQKKRQSNKDSIYFEKLKALSPDATVSNDMLVIWSLVLAGYCEQSSYTRNLYSWSDTYKYNGITTALKKDIREILSPKIQFKKPYTFRANEQKTGLKSIIDWDIVLSNSHIHSAIERLNELPQWQNDIALLLPEFNALLKETMEIMSDLGDVEEFHDYSYIHHPSIKVHPQNKDYNDWTALIDLVRDSWLSLNKLCSESANSMIIQWWKTPYPIFKRLVFFAASEVETIPISLINTWLEENNSRWLWNVVTQREIFQLLPTLFKTLDGRERESKRLLSNITKGPLREWFKEALSDEEFERICEREIWLRLEKLKHVEFDKNTTQLYQSITVKHPQWKPSPDEKDDFPFWMGDGEDLRTSTTSPSDLIDLVKWLKDKPNHDRWDEDDWSLRCKDDFENSSKALLILIEEKVWIAERWREALQVWTEDEKLSNNAWEKLSNTIFNLNRIEVIDISWNLARWLKNKTKQDKINDHEYFQFLDILLGLPYQINLEEINDPLNGAINHPVGIVTESLFNWWYRQKPTDNDGLIPEFKKRLNKICGSDTTELYYGKVVVASNVLSLFRVDPEWTNKNVLPWFEWENEELANMSWRSYLWSPRLHKGLLLQLKADLLETASHFEKLDSHKEQYARFLTYTALQNYTEYKPTELATAFNHLPSEAFFHVVSSLKDGLTSSGEKFSEYWEHRVKVFLHKTWPKQVEINDNTVNHLGLLCLATKDYFDEAFTLIRHSLRQTDENEYLVRETFNSGLINKFPSPILTFLDTLIGEPKFKPARKLRSCLDEIILNDDTLQTHRAYIRLSTLVRRYE